MEYGRIDQNVLNYRIEFLACCSKLSCHQYFYHSQQFLSVWLSKRDETGWLLRYVSMSRGHPRKTGHRNMMLAGWLALNRVITRPVIQIALSDLPTVQLASVPLSRASTDAFLLRYRF